ncbi:flagellar basal body P-ring formation chaperone FlgA [Acuticoccus sp.]|uniref:flagellar basal body P-ring formation chaperone FlgA n=1 Tax=Acuticoccus sp. TaxID=1904378 RepID=UPI003B525848
MMARARTLAATPSPKSVLPRAAAATALAILAATLVGEARGAEGANAGGLLPVPAFTIEQGEVVSADMLTERHFYFDPNRPLSVLTDPARAIGREARRTLPAGKPIPASAFRAAKLVHRGRPTEARFRMGTLTITATVLPQSDGGVGDLVRARNVDSDRTVSGIVAMDGAIEVSAP